MCGTSSTARTPTTTRPTTSEELPVKDRLTTRVCLTLTDDSTHDKTVAHPRGTGDHAFTNDDIIAKDRKLTHSVISPLYAVDCCVVIGLGHTLPIWLRRVHRHRSRSPLSE